LLTLAWTDPWLHSYLSAAFIARELPEPTIVWNALAEASLLALAPGAIEDDRVLIAHSENRLSAVRTPPPLY